MASLTGNVPMPTLLIHLRGVTGTTEGSYGFYPLPLTPSPSPSPFPPSFFPSPPVTLSSEEA